MTPRECLRASLPLGDVTQLRSFRVTLASGRTIRLHGEDICDAITQAQRDGVVVDAWGEPRSDDPDRNPTA